MPTLSNIRRSPSDVYLRPETSSRDSNIVWTSAKKPLIPILYEPLVIKAGNVMDILKTNMQYSRYVINLCQMIHDGCAYFPVHYREYYRQGFTNTSDPRHPSFILNIPKSFCHSLVALHLRMNSAYYVS